MELDRASFELVIESVAKRLIKEYRYNDTITPHNSQTNRAINLGRNPLSVDNGGHSNNDVVGQVSTVDDNGSNFTPNDDAVILSPNQLRMYKIKNFGNDNVMSTLSFFGNGKEGEKALRLAIDQLNGGATRNHKNVTYRVITDIPSMDVAAKSGYMQNSFWEFSLGDGRWFILKPEPLENIRQSQFNGVGKSKEDIAKFKAENPNASSSYNQTSNYMSPEEMKKREAARRDRERRKREHELRGR